MKFQSDSVNLQVDVLDAQTGEKLREKKVNFATIFVADPGQEVLIRVEGSGTALNEEGTFCAYCYVGELPQLPPTCNMLPC